MVFETISLKLDSFVELPACLSTFTYETYVGENVKKQKLCVKMVYYNRSFFLLDNQMNNFQCFAYRLVEIPKVRST